MTIFHNNPWRVNIAALCISLVARHAIADDKSATESPSSNRETTLEEVIVSGHPLSAEGLAQPFAVLDGEALKRAQAASIGETLMHLPSVSSTSFGQAVGRPVVRGLGGPRVKVLEDRIDTLDVSVSSPDHATTIDAFTAESIEVFMGPGTLVYGSGAIGGVVDVHTGRIPHAVPEEASARFEGRYADNADRWVTAGRADAGEGNFAFHVDGFYRDADDYDIPGYAESKRLRQMEEAEEHEEHEAEEHHEHEEEEAKDTLPGSYLETWGAAIGGSYVTDNGFLGLAVSRYESDYGLPGHTHEHGHAEHEDEEHEDEEHAEEEHAEEEHHHDEEGTPELNMKQTRVDLEWGQEAPFAGFDSLNLRIGYNDYEHTESEPDGVAGTKWELDAWEGRFELVHSELSSVQGVIGLQASHYEFSALGDEAFVEPVDTDKVGVFYVAQTDLGSLGIEGGVRAEYVEQDPDTGSSQDYSLFSGSLGLIQPLSDAWQLTGQLDYSSRAPTAVELYSDGPHLATLSFEIGDPDLDEEKAANISLGTRYQSGRWQLALNAYFTHFDGFIYEESTGEEEDGLPVLQWTQEDAEFYGGDVSAQWEALSWNRGVLSLLASADTVRGKLDEGEDKDLPRIPPMRWSVGLNMNWANLMAELIYTRAEKQDDTAPNELPSDSYNDVRVHVEYAMGFRDSRVVLFLNGTNLTDDEQRLNTSWIKDLAPQPGRTIEAGIRVML